MTELDAKNVFNFMWCSKSQASRQRNPRGNGVGLFVCKKICEGLGGDISVETAVGKGCIFNFSQNIYDLEKDSNNQSVDDNDHILNSR